MPLLHFFPVNHKKSASLHLLIISHPGFLHNQKQPRVREHGIPPEKSNRKRNERECIAAFSLFQSSR